MYARILAYLYTYWPIYLYRPNGFCIRNTSYMRWLAKYNSYVTTIYVHGIPATGFVNNRNSIVNSTMGAIISADMQLTVTGIVYSYIYGYTIQMTVDIY